jgi:DNA primase
MSTTDEIKSRLDIVELVESYLPLRKSGNSYSGFCPFHSNTRTPAFVVFPETQTWRCFGACAEGGDIFSFMMKKEGWDFKEALKVLAERAGVELQPPNPQQLARQSEQEEISDLLTLAADYFHTLLRFAPEAEYARQYVEQRGLAEETVAAFKLGFALDSWDAARTHFQAQGYTVQDLLDAGLLTHNEDKGTTYDRFRNRLMIPIRNSSGQIVGFGARTLEKDGIPKYLNSPQTLAFDKSRLLFGLDMAKRNVRDEKQVIIVEGYMDVIQAWQAGFRNVVAQMGTALTGDQLAALKRYTRRFVISLDADQAGVQATMRSLQVARNTLDREADARFDARGLVRHEGRLKADIYVMSLPAGKDPDNIIRADPAQWKQLVAKAKPVVEYVIDVLTADLDVRDPKAKTEAAQQILPLIEDVGDPVEREHYRQHLARVLRTDERALRQLQLQTARESSAPPRLQPAQNGKRNGKRNGSGNGNRNGGGQRKAGTTLALGQLVDTSKREANYLREVQRQPHLLFEINRKLEEFQQPPVSLNDFTSAEHKALYCEIESLARDGVLVEPEELCDNLTEPLASRWREIISAGRVESDGLAGRFAISLVLSLLDCRLERSKQQMAELKVLLLQAQADDDEQLRALYSAQVNELSGAFRRINRAKGALSSGGRRREVK